MLPSWTPSWISQIPQRCQLGIVPILILWAFLYQNQQKPAWGVFFARFTSKSGFCCWTNRSYIFLSANNHGNQDTLIFWYFFYFGLYISGICNSPRWYCPITTTSFFNSVTFTLICVIQRKEKIYLSMHLKTFSGKIFTWLRLKIPYFVTIVEKGTQ